MFNFLSKRYTLSIIRSFMKETQLKIFNDQIVFKTKGFCHVVDVTDHVKRKIRESELEEGLITLFVVGSTAALTTVEYEPGLVKDLETFFEELAPQEKYYHHEETWHDGNGFSHIRASLLKPSLTVPIVRGEMTLGTWQQIILIDFDNKERSRKLAIQIMGDRGERS